jgi:N-acetylmuramoyl-L-alanine amidase
VSPAAVHRRPLPYVESLQARPLERIDLVVIHCTELPDLAMARQYGEKVLYPQSASGNSGHYYVDRCGRTEEWVPLDRAAHHVRGHNSRSVGIELVNLGRYPHWLDSRHQHMTEPYPAAQIEALLSLLLELERSLPALRWIAGHDSLDTSEVTATDDPRRSVYRKLDPGPLFPWRSLLEAIGLERLQGETLARYRSGSA